MESHQGSTSFLVPITQEVTHTPTNQKKQTNAAVTYLLSLHSKLSRKKMGYYLQKVAQILTGQNNILYCSWGDLRRHHIQAIMNILIEGHRSPSTMNTYLSALKGVAHEAWMLEQMSMEHYQHIKQIKGVRGERITKGRALNPSEIEQIFHACDLDKSCRGVRDSAIFAVLIGCGLRRNELVNLNLNNISWEDQSIRLIGKGNKERIAFMPQSTVKRLEHWVSQVRGDHAGPLFTRIRRYDDMQETRMTDQAIYSILRSRSQAAQITDFSPHDLRRTYANQLLDHGVDIMTVKDMMGHNSITTTQRYIRIKDDKMKRASALLNF